jgi:hypothetical protein
MRTLYTLLLVSLAHVALAQFPVNGGFENWTEIETYANPDVTPSDFASGNQEFFQFLGEAPVTEVTGVTGSAMRLETYVVEDDILPGFAIWGGTPDGDDLLFPGGFDFDDMAVEGLSVDLRYDINLTSPGVILVQFKAGGETVSGGPDDGGTYFFPVAGEQVDFTTMTFDFDPPITETPDQVVIAFTSNDIISEPATGFSGDFMEVDNVSFVGSDIDVPGGNLDTWAPGPIINMPDDWETAAGPISSFAQSDNAFEGDYAIELETIPLDPDESEFFPGIVFKGSIGDDGIVASVPLPSEAVGLNFAYDYIPEEEDSAIVMLVLSEDLENSEESVYFIGEILYATKGYDTGYLDFSEVFGFMNPQYYALVFFSSFTEGFEEIDHAGSTLYVDAVNFEIDEGACDFDPTIDSGNITLCPGETITVSTEDDWDSFQWYYDQAFNPGNPLPLDGQTNNSIDIDNSYVGNIIWCEATLDGCAEETYSFVVDEYFFLAPSISIQGPSEVCEPDQVLMSNGFGDYGSYQWQLDGMNIDGATADSYLAEESGEYTLVVTPFECPMSMLSSISETITINPLPEPSIDQTGNDVNTTDNYVSYQWFLDGMPIVGADDSTWEAEEDGEYYVEVTDSNGCIGTSDTINVIVTAVEEEALSINALYPNPAGNGNELTIETTPVQGMIQLVNVTGQIVATQPANGTIHRIQMAHLAQGLYFVKVISDTAEITMRWVK